ncbi:hypothetical protein BLNAU_20119 [Blattamonas nauphoetae]|uniref:Uncharacterized protein n=1 Tax=Blattamonas nauphoetae TaxID=2049346 RepID=A0ABQ9X041_9EUKA|nr:hypothetical protein BLNAU_20119 [Blattamonas nauphoetae]
MEDSADTIEGRLLTDRKGDWGGGVVSKWMVLRNLVGLNDGQPMPTFFVFFNMLPLHSWILRIEVNITTAAMAMVRNVIERCSHHHRLTLIKAALIPQIVITLNPQSHSFVDAVDIHTCLMRTITCSLWLTTPSVLASLTVKDGSEQQAVHETVLTQVLIPSEKYIRHLCVNRFSILDGKQSRSFLDLLARLLEICPYYQPTMDVVLHMPVFFTIPSSLTFFDHNLSIWTFLIGMNNTQLEWNEQGGKVRQMWKTMHRMLRMEGFEDGKEAKLQNDRNATDGRWIVYSSIGWNNKLGMNVPKLW